jgi:hypothetical protein
MTAHARAVLVIERGALAGRTAPGRLRLEMDAAARLGIVVVALVDPADAREAHEMIASGAADCIAYGRPSDLPTVVMLTTPGRTAPLPRDGESPTQRRPQLVGQRTQPVDRTGEQIQQKPVESALEIVQAMDDSPPVRRRRASDRSLRRRRRT